MSQALNKFKFGIPRRSSTLPAESLEALTASEKNQDTASEHSTGGVSDDSGITVVPLVPPTLKIKRVDYYYSRWTKGWKYKNMGDKVTPEKVVLGSGSTNDAWQGFCFVVVRTLSRNDEEPTFHVVIKSPYLVQALKTVMQELRGISWNADPLQLSPQLLIAFLPQFEAYHAELKKKKRTQEESYIMTTVEILVDYLHRDYKGTIATIKNLTSHGEITWDLLYAIFVPRTILVTTCPVTGEPRALRLVSSSKISISSGSGFYDLVCENVDAVDQMNKRTNGESDAEAEVRRAGGGPAFGRVESRLLITSFKGTMKINSLDAYPIQFDVDGNRLRKVLTERGKKWVSLKGVHHMQYKGICGVVVPLTSGETVVKYNVNSRIMVDRETFRRQNPTYVFPVIQQQTQPVADPFAHTALRRSHVESQEANIQIPTLQVQRRTTALEQHEDELSEEELILTPTVVYGFSLSDKLWLEFNLELISPIVWNEEAFRNLVLPDGRKHLLQSLVEAHNMDIGFDDFVRGKGDGLVINLFGPPGVGKTLSAEATSEHVRRPLYVVGSGDLGTTATELDANLQRIFDIATGWKAIVLIDEADVFLEQRSLHDLDRNAMVAIFLRHVEYYRGILFLTTNRVKTFDEAFLSRIHVALHFQELTKEARTQVWRAFLAKAGVTVGQSALDDRQFEQLTERNINGRQIKNATRTAKSLAASHSEPLNYQHLVETLDAMDEFTNEFRAMSAA